MNLPSRAPAASYSIPAAAFHWLLAFAIAVSFSVGLYMADLPLSPQKLKLYNWHKWAGITILGLSALRLLWRLSHKPPPDPPMPAWQRATAHATHYLMYLLFFAIPLIGWAYSSAAGFPIVWFGVLPLPDFVPVDKVLAETLKPWHGWLAKLLGGLVLFHVGAALHHQFVDRDELIRRMWPRRARAAADDQA